MDLINRLLADEEFVGSLPPDGSSQDSDVQMEMGDEWCPPGVHL